MTNKAKSVLSVLIITLLVVGGLAILVKHGKDEEAKLEIEFSKGYAQTRGIITSFHSYKGRTLEVKYYVNGKEYYHRRSWDMNRKRLGKADSIYIKYAITDPNRILTELEKKYYLR